MFKVIKGKQRTPRRILLYGTHGIGKSTWAADAPSPIFIQCEDGLADIGADRTELLKEMGQVIDTLYALIREPHDYRTCVIDTLDWLERLIHAAVAQEKGKSCIEDIPYKAGYLLALKHWNHILRALDDLRGTRNMAVILLAHAKVEKFDAPDLDTYSRYSPDLHKGASPMVQEWADEVLFATFRVNTVREEQGFNVKVKAVGVGERIVHTCEAPTHMAKRRLVMPDVIDLKFSEYVQCIRNSRAESTQTNDPMPQSAEPGGDVASALQAGIDAIGAPPMAPATKELQEAVLAPQLDCLSLDTPVQEPGADGDIAGIVVDGSSKVKEVDSNEL
jgi:hypothetical protein